MVLFIIMQNKVKDKTIIVTGASSGIGERLVWEIARNGGKPVMLARSQEKLYELQRQLQTELKATSCVYPVDLSDENQTEQTVVKILSEHPIIHALINNAGIGMFDYVKDVNWNDVKDMFDLNVLSLIKLTHLLLPHFINKQDGHIINVASQAGKIATPKSSIYASTKHAVIGFSNALRIEMKQENVQVTTVNLGPVRTNFFELADPHGSYQKNVERYMLDPEKVAKKITQHLFSNRREINLPWWMELGSKFNYLFPKTLEKLLKKQFNQK
ncbi:SDR family NAD(P)-dependent oxidoreductase [Ornithinibacillus halophilus]|uniref:Short-chain dehydrogenase n=1 Tax=Ornithinibacillus halophilus TaxID=930117 RepID=A0A1M5CVL9_9BACI|nr:SDR family oxidoreductase [Ornithinibacillus halophilus]SHF58666.1 hypothetical protein SAMN05216225_1001407 [Ornithinibacillus halophilus]